MISSCDLKTEKSVITDAEVQRKGQHRKLFASEGFMAIRRLERSAHTLLLKTVLREEGEI